MQADLGSIRIACDDINSLLFTIGVTISFQISPGDLEAVPACYSGGTFEISWLSISFKSLP